VKAFGFALPGAGTRLITVGGAGALRVSRGQLLWDTEGRPEHVVQIMHASGDALDYPRGVSDLAWTVISPAALGY
jgi:putative NADH-flavin reductase